MLQELMELRRQAAANFSHTGPVYGDTALLTPPGSNLHSSELGAGDQVGAQHQTQFAPTRYSSSSILDLETPHEKKRTPNHKTSVQTYKRDTRHHHGDGLSTTESEASRNLPKRRKEVPCVRKNQEEEDGEAASNSDSNDNQSATENEEENVLEVVSLLEERLTPLETACGREDTGEAINPYKGQGTRTKQKIPELDGTTPLADTSPNSIPNDNISPTGLIISPSTSVPPLRQFTFEAVAHPSQAYGHRNNRGLPASHGYHPYLSDGMRVARGSAGRRKFRGALAGGHLSRYPPNGLGHGIQRSTMHRRSGAFSLPRGQVPLQFPQHMGPVHPPTGNFFTHPIEHLLITGQPQDHIVSNPHLSPAFSIQHQVQVPWAKTPILHNTTGPCPRTSQQVFKCPTACRPCII